MIDYQSEYTALHPRISFVARDEIGRTRLLECLGRNGAGGARSRQCETSIGMMFQLCMKQASSKSALLEGLFGACQIP